MKVVHIYRDDTMDDINISTIKHISDYSKSQGENDISLLYTWLYESHEFHCYGWYDGESGFENKHELPPGGNSTFLEEDSSSQLLFGDLFICQMDVATTQYVDCDISEYGEFYNMCFEGFHNILSSEEEEDTEDVNDDENDVNDVNVVNDEIDVETDDDTDDDIESEDELIPEIHSELEIDTHLYE
jgi:hypothetical protein